MRCAACQCLRRGTCAGEPVSALTDTCADKGSGRARFITFADEAGAKAVFTAGEFHTIGSKQIQVKHATPRGSMPQPQPGSAAPGPGAGPSGSRMVFAPRPGFAGGYGGAVGQPGAYGPMGAYGPPMQYHVGPGYGMPAYGQVRAAALCAALFLVARARGAVCLLRSGKLVRHHC